MDIRVRVPAYTDNNSIVMSDNGEDELVYVAEIIDKEVILSIDGSTTCTGIGLIDKESGDIVCTMALIKEDKTDSIRYKVEFKRFIQKLLSMIPYIRHIYYEEPFIGSYANATKALMMLRTSVQEVIIENEPGFDYIKFIEVNNKKWKKKFLYPGTCPNDTELEKKAIRDKIVSMLPFLGVLTQDELDACAMGFTALKLLKDDNEKELETKHKPRPFKYNTWFIGADDDDDMIQQYSDGIEEQKIPQVLLDKGADIIEINGNGTFDNKVYNAMGNEDRLIILKYKSNNYGHIALKNNIGYMVGEYKYIYAVIWRKSRK